METNSKENIDTNKTRLSITLPVWLLNDLQKIAEVKGQSVNSVIVNANFKFLMDFKKDYKDFLKF